MTRKQQETAEGLVIHSLARGLDEIARCMEYILVPNGITCHVTPIIQTGGVRAKKCTAWTARGYTGEDGKLQPYWSTREGQGTIEVTLVAEHLNRPTLSILETVIHESVHVAANALGIKDTAKSGRHNKQFKELAERFGLVVAVDPDTGKPLGKQGYAQTSLGDVLKERLITDFVPNENAFNVFRNTIIKVSKPAQPKFECPDCGEFVRGHGETKTRPATNVICGDCKVKMVQEEVA